jgi:predicted ATPase
VPGRIPAWNISEGSVRLVATLLAMFVPEPPALVAIESPDTSLHPYLMEYLAELLKLGSRHTQVVITTHSPYLLDHLPPESLRIVTKEHGATKVKEVKRTKALAEALKVLGLGDMWRAGHLGGVP